MMFRIFIFLWVMLAPFHAAAADAVWLISEINKAKKDAVITIPAGEYDLTDLKIRKNLTLKGNGEVVFFSSRTTAKGILNPMPFVSIHIENITFRNAVSPDLNGAGIRHDGHNLTVVNCTFVENENGILSTGDDDGAIVIERSTFISNGHGDGYSHGIYLSSGKTLEIQNSRFVGTRIGHHIKSLAKTTTISGTTLDDADGRTSYSIDASRGGAVTITDNTILQSASSDNAAIINYDLTRGGKAEALTITNNKIINRHRRGVFLRNDTRLTPTISGNEVSNENGGRLEMGEAAEKGPTAVARLKSMLTTIRNEREADTSPAPEARPLSLPKTIQPAGKQKLLTAPEISSEPDALFSFRLDNNTNTKSNADYVTFAHPLPAGVLKDQQVLARFDGAASQAQIDVKALHPDGSVRHAIFTVMAPSLKAGASMNGAILIKADSAANETSFDAKALLTRHYNFPLGIAFQRKGLEPRSFYTNLRDAVLAADMDVGSWLDGPLVKEFRIEKTAAAHLRLRADIRVYRDGDIRTSVAFVNDKTFSPGSRNLLYDVIIGKPETPVYAAGQIAHHRSSLWRQVIWSGNTPRLHLVHDLRALEKSGAILPLDASIGVRSQVIDSNLDALSEENPLSPALLQQYLPYGGGRPDIGLYTQWTANYLVTQNEAAKAVMLVTAEAAGAAPWHLRDERTGDLVRIDKRKKFWADERGLKPHYSPDRAHPDLYDGDDGGWTLDHAHRPSLSYIPYLVTGDRHFADNLAAQSAYALSGRWPDLRDGLKVIDVEQVSGSAWSLRDISNAAYILPDNDALKDYFQAALDINLSSIAKKYVAGRSSSPAGELEGYFDELNESDPQRVSPWQNDFMAMALSAAARQSSDETADNARALLSWTANFQSGRFLSDSYDINRAPVEALKAKTANTQAPLSQWKEIAQVTYGNAPPLSQMEGYPNYAAGYIASAYGALALIASETQSLAALEAFATLARVNRKHGMWRIAEDGGAARNNGFIFSLTLRDGALLSRDQFFKKINDAPRFLISGGAMTGGDFGDLLAGDRGDDQIVGGGGSDDLFGGHGNDEINGGKGDDRLIGGDGNDVLTGGDGADIFAFRINEKGGDEILEFNTAEDKIGVILKHGDTLPAAIRNTVATPEGARINFSENSFVLLRNVNAATLQNSHFIAIQ